MKRISALFCLLLTAGFTTTALSQTAPAAAGPTKIAVIAFQPALAQTNEGQRAIQALQTKYEPTQQHLKSLSDEIESLKKQLQADGDKLSAQEKASRTQTIDTKDKQLQLEAEDAQTRYQSDIQDTFAKIADKVGKVLVNYVQTNGYTLVIDVSGQASNVLWYTPSTDITKAIIEAYNASTPSITAPAAPTAARPAAPRPATPAK